MPRSRTRRIRRASARIRRKQRSGARRTHVLRGKPAKD